MTAILVLNWNGAEDTIACLQSLANAEGAFCVYVIDIYSLTYTHKCVDTH